MVFLCLSRYSVLSRKLKPHLVADTVKQYISRAQRTTKKGSQEQQNNMEFLRGVYAFMQVSRSSVSVNCFHFNNCTNPYQLALLFNTGNFSVLVLPYTTYHNLLIRNHSISNRNTIFTKNKNLKNLKLKNQIPKNTKTKINQPICNYYLLLSYLLILLLLLLLLLTL